MECDYGWASTYCEQYDGQWRCNCDSPYGFTEYTLSGAQDSEACGYVAELCSEGTPTGPSDAAMCTQGFTDSGPGYCGMDMECRRSVQVADGVTAQTVEWRNAYCNEFGGTWSCDCWAGGQSARVELPSPQSNPGVCAEVVDLCGSASLLPSGPAECSPTFQSTDRSWCDVQLECTYSQILNGQEIDIIAYEHVGCERLDGNLWDCWCDGLAGVEGFTITSDNGWETCSIAGDRCADNL
jgi:hypothetical protein